MKFINVGIAQINPKVGDLEGNFQKILWAIEDLSKKTHIIVFPELVLCGYPPEDLLLTKDFLSDVNLYIEKLLKISLDFETLIIIGTPYHEKHLYNGVLLVYKGRIWDVYYKKHLSNSNVFDEKRYFNSGDKLLFFEVEGIKIGVFIYEDVKHLSETKRAKVFSSAKVLFILDSSPYTYGEYRFKENFLRTVAKENKVYVVYINLVGGQDDLIFDGRSLVISPEGEILGRGKAFEEDLFVVSLPFPDTQELESGLKVAKIPLKKEITYFASKIEDNPQEEAEIYQALTLAIRDYVYKNRFKGVVLGLSGGIDSALVVTLAVDALGKDKVKAFFMPSEFTSKESEEDAKVLAKNLGIDLIEIPITRIFKTYREEIKTTLCYEDFTVAEENLQARIRANLLFYFSNREGHLVLSTSNKSEAATGYGTIYGDMAGGFAPLKDIYKTWVYKLAKYRNSLGQVIPERIFKKPPSAELRPGQTDQDTLPPYEELDEILKLHLEEGLGLKEIIEKGFKEEVVKKVFQMLKLAEYKRRQTPVGPKITRRAFGRDYKVPVTCGYP